MVCHWYFSDDLNFIAGHLTLMDGNGHRYTVPIHTHTPQRFTLMYGSTSKYRGCVQRSDFTLCVDLATIYSLPFYYDYLQRSDILPIFMHSSITYTQSVCLMHSRHGMPCSRETHNLHTVDANNVSGEILSSLRNGKHKTKTKKKIMVYWINQAATIRMKNYE